MIKKKLADINSDGDVTIGDVVLLNRQVLGKDTPATVKLAPKKSRKKAAARASEEMKISVDNVSTKAGETISIPVRISNNQGIAGIAFSVELPEGYSLVSMKKGEVTSEGTFTVSENNCTWYTTDNIKTDGILLTLEVKAGENAKTGKIKVNVKDGKANNISDENGMTVPAVFTEGTVTIQEDSCAVNGHKGGKATCIKKAVCTVCGKEYGEVDPTNHEGETELRNVKKATCTEDGNTGDTYCKSCGTKIKDGKVIKALGHKFTKYVSDNNATTTKDGTKTARCDNGCGTKNTVVDKGSKKTNSSQSPKIKIGQKLQNSVGVRCAITGKNTAECIGYVGKKNSVTIPPSLKYMGVTYQITSIKTKAFSGNKNLRSIVIPSSIRTIGSQAFFKCKNLKKITIKTPYLSKKTVGAKAFKGIHAKAKIKVPKKQKKAYQKLLKAKGAGKKVTIK
ncbi:leucine-rich repeat protein [Anaerobutyricum hallii]|uniref:leucine-rich repeat protein n=2 Tax=Anaerobutyricum hallii TaxID=39488 RepID=UPI003AB4633B